MPMLKLCPLVTLLGTLREAGSGWTARMGTRRVLRRAVGEYAGEEYGRARGRAQTKRTNGGGKVVMGVMAKDLEAKKAAPSQLARRSRVTPLVSVVGSVDREDSGIRLARCGGRGFVRPLGVTVRTGW